MKILLCEDDANIATIARMALEHIGQHKVTWADNGEDALRIGLSEKFDLILLDEMMPRMNGIKVCEEYIKQSTHRTPVIFMSANPQDQKVLQLRPLAIGYIPKPFDPMDLNGVISQIMNSQEQSAA